MKLYKTKVNCRGCQKGAVITFEEPSTMMASIIPFTCEKCGSELVAHVKRKWFQDKIDIKVNMVKHTQTLLNILKRRKLA